MAIPIGDISEETRGVFKVVAAAFDVAPAALTLRSREANTNEARQVAMYVICKTEEYSFTAIGKALGGRSPATVSHGFQRIAELLPHDKALESRVSRIMSLL